MNMADYCFEKGMELEQFEQYEKNIEAAAIAILQCVKSNYIVDNGVYYNTSEIINYQSDKIQAQFIIQELKKQGFEFIENGKKWRL